MTHFNGLSPAEAERLAILLEEMGEAQQAIGKILRHGYESRHPDGGPTNREALVRELGDTYFAMRHLASSMDLSWDAIADRALTKTKAVRQYLHHQWGEA